MSSSGSLEGVCGRCSSSATIDCSAQCGNMRYCSTNCCDLHKPEHESICAAFKAQEKRPDGYPDRDLHYRAISFPKGNDQLRLVWLRYLQSSSFRLSQSNIEALMQGPVERYKVMRPGYNHQWLEIIGRHTLFPDPSQNNKAVARLLGWEASGVWRGNILVRGIIQEDFEPIEGVDDGEEKSRVSRVRAPVDLDTRDLACITAYLRRS